MTGQGNKIILFGIVCLFTVFAYPVDDAEKTAKPSDAPSMVMDYSTMSAVFADAKKEDQKPQESQQPSQQQTPPAPSDAEKEQPQTQQLPSEKPIAPQEEKKAEDKQPMTEIPLETANPMAQDQKPKEQIMALASEDKKPDVVEQRTAAETEVLIPAYKPETSKAPEEAAATTSGSLDKKPEEKSATEGTLPSEPKERLLAGEQSATETTKLENPTTAASETLASSLKPETKSELPAEAKPELPAEAKSELPAEAPKETPEMQQTTQGLAEQSSTIPPKSSNP